MKRLVTAGFVMSALTSSAFATNPPLRSDSQSGCGHFHVQISNLTDATCVLVNVSVGHGNLISAPPGTIMPNDSKVFDMEQTIIGPEVTLSYQCGPESISFTSKQDLCFLEAGNITGTLLHPVPNRINASYTALIGSYFWEKPGSINWRIIKAG